METDPGKTDNFIKLQMDSFQGRQFNFFSSIVTLIMGAVFLIATNTPTALINTEKAPSDCYSPIYDALGYKCAPYNLANNPVLSVKISELSFHKFIILQISPLQTKFGQRTSINVPVEVSAYSISSEKEASISSIVFKEKKELAFECSFSQYAPCNFEQVINLENVDSGDYYIVMNFLLNEEVANTMQDFEVQAVTLNKSFRYYFIFVKFIFIICAIGLHLWKTNKMQQFDQVFYSPEHEAMKFITPLAILLNIPFDGSLFDSFLYTIFQITVAVFLSTVLLRLWLNLLHQIAGFESSVQEQSSQFVKIFLIAYFAITWLTYVVFGTSVTKDPLSDFSSTTNSLFNLLKFLLYGTLLAALGWSALKITNVMKRLSELSERENRFFWFSVIFMIFQLYLTATGGLYFRNLDGTKFLLFSGLTILYAAAVCYLFIPTEEGLNQAQYLKKYNNPIANEAYKDLEMSNETPKPEAAPEQDMHLHNDKEGYKDLETSDEAKKQTGSSQEMNFETYQKLNQKTSNTKNEIEQGYPFESKRDEEEL